MPRIPSGPPVSEPTPATGRLRLYTMAELAQEMGVSDDTLKSWIEAGHIGAVLVGTRHRIPEESVRRFYAAVASGRFPG